MGKGKSKGKVTGGARAQAIVRDRVIELRKALPSEVQDHPLNWRVHTKKQHAAMRGLLGEVGYVKPIDVYIPRPDDALVTEGVVVGGETRKLKPGVPCIMDGHMRRKDVPEDFKLSLNITDLTETEAIKYLATCDPLSAMADQDDGLLVQALAMFDSDNAAVQAMLSDLVDLGDEDDALGLDDGAPEGNYQIIIECKDEEEQRVLVEQLTAEGRNFRALIG